MPLRGIGPISTVVAAPVVSTPSGTQRGDVLVWASVADIAGSAINSGALSPFVRATPPRFGSTGDGAGLYVGTCTVKEANPSTYTGAGGDSQYAVIVGLSGVTTAGLRSTRMQNNTLRASPWRLHTGVLRVVERSDLLWIATSDINSSSATTTHVIPQGFTQIGAFQSGFFTLVIAYKPDVPAGYIGGTTGTGSASTTAGYAAALLAFPRVGRRFHARTLVPSTLSASIRASDALRARATVSGSTLRVRMG